MPERYDEIFMDAASASELEAAAHDVYLKLMRLEFGTPEYDGLSDLHERLISRLMDLRKNPDPNYRWTDANRWDR
jgi:predicted solute-binding protein